MELLVFIIFSLLEVFTKELRGRNRSLNLIAWNILLFDMATLYQVSSAILDESRRQEVGGQLSEIANWSSAKGIMGCTLQSLSKYSRGHLNSPSLNYSDFMCFEVLLF